jgi:drug/metabolite transporter (DMT)-like permease
MTRRAAPGGAAADRGLRWRIIGAFAAVYVIWGSTYLGILYAIETIPPFLMAGIRFLVAGAIVYAYARARGAAPPRPRHWRTAAVAGMLLLLGGNGAVVWAEQTVPTGIVSLIVAMTPVWMVLLEWMRVEGARPSGRVFAGLALGFAGMAVLIGPSAWRGAAAFPLLSALVVLAGSFAWSAGSIYARGAEHTPNPLVGTGMQMLAGGAALVLLGTLSGEPARFSVSAISLRSWGGLVYLIVFGSLVGYTCYVWLLRVSTPARVSTYAYVNPIVAVFLGWAFAGEAITSRELAAATIIVAAVALIVSGKVPGTGRSTAAARVLPADTSQSRFAHSDSTRR